jgi:hypothetical protein
MRLYKKTIGYGIYTVLAVSTGLLVASGVTKTAEFAYAELGKPGQAFFASIDFPTLHFALPSFKKNSDLLAESITYTRQAETAPTEDTKQSGVNFSTQASDDTIRIGWVGDITPVVSTKMEAGFAPFGELSELLKLPDLMVGNLEGVITENIVSKCKADTANCFAFRGDIGFVDYLTNAGFDVMNMANNHAFDFGKASFTDTQNALQSKNIASTGAPDQISIVETKGVKVAFVGFAPNANTNPLLDTEHIRKTIADAKSQADIVVAVMHAGAEGVSYLHVTDADEIYLNENRGNTMAQAHVMIDAGADIVLGSGPHVLRGLELYKGKMIAYSLGNFFASSNLSTRGILSLSGILMIDLDKDGTPKVATLVPVYLDTNGMPHVDPVATAIPLVKKLSREDFGENALVISDDGIISIPHTQ